MAQLLGLEGSEQPALAGVHQAQQQVDLFVQHLLRVGRLAAADGAGAVIGSQASGAQVAFHGVLLTVR